MLLHIEQSHAPEDCSYGKGGSTPLFDGDSKDVKIHGYRLAFPLRDHARQRSSRGTARGLMEGAESADVMGVCARAGSPVPCWPWPSG